MAEALIAVHDLPAPVFGATRAMNLPALTVTAREMADALARFGAERTLGRVSFAPERGLQAIVDGWPKVFVSAPASRHGIQADASFDDIIRFYIEDYLTA